MSLYDSIQKEYIQARKSKDAFATQILSMLVSDLKYIKINQQKDEVPDDDVISFIQKEIKQKTETMTEAEKTGRDELAAKEKEEIAFLQKYLPEEISDEELRAIVVQVKNEIGASSPSDMGNMMKEVMPKVKGRTDGSKVKNVVMDVLKNG